MLRKILLTTALTLAAFGITSPVLAQDGPLRIEITEGVIEPMPFAIVAFDDGGALPDELRCGCGRGRVLLGKVVHRYSSVSRFSAHSGRDSGTMSSW